MDRECEALPLPSAEEGEPFLKEEPETAGERRGVVGSFHGSKDQEKSDVQRLDHVSSEVHTTIGDWCQCAELWLGQRSSSSMFEACMMSRTVLEDSILNDRLVLRE